MVIILHTPSERIFSDVNPLTRILKDCERTMSQDIADISRNNAGKTGKSI